MIKALASESFRHAPRGFSFATRFPERSRRNCTEMANAPCAPWLLALRRPCLARWGRAGCACSRTFASMRSIVLPPYATHRGLKKLWGGYSSGPPPFLPIAQQRRSRPSAMTFALFACETIGVVCIARGSDAIQGRWEFCGASARTRSNWTLSELGRSRRRFGRGRRSARDLSHQRRYQSPSSR